MIYVSDIEEEISRKDIRALETAFCVLVGYPSEDSVQGALNPDHLSDLLHRVAVTLEMDQSAMPGGTVEILQEVMDGELFPRTDYAAGSTIVREHADHWHAIFTRHAD